MDEKPDQIIGQIEAQRAELGRNLNELETRVRRSTDWRTYYDKNPLMVLGAALGGGLLLGSMVGGKRSTSSSRYSGSYSSAPASASMGSTGSNVKRPAGPATSIAKTRVNETIDHVKAALIGFGVAQVREFLTAAIPGFDRHLDDAERNRRENVGNTQGYPGGQDFRTHAESSSYRGGYSSASDYRAPEAAGSTPSNRG